jgi:hypothetical protein
LYWGNPKQQGTKSWQALNVNGPCAIHFWNLKKKLPFTLKDIQQFQMNLLQCSCKPLDRLLVQQVSKLKNVKISSFVKDLLFLLITTPWKKCK